MDRVDFPECLKRALRPGGSSPAPPSVFSSGSWPKSSISEPCSLSTRTERSWSRPRPRLGGLLGLARFEKLLAGATTAAVWLWLLVAFTPLTHWLGEGLVRRDSVEKADAVFVLASSLQSDGDFSTAAMSRLLGGLDLLGRGLAPRLILSELPPPSRRYRDAASKLMSFLGLNHEILEVGPVSNTHDEAVAVGALARERGLSDRSDNPIGDCIRIR